jgi:hypothetical protein
MGDAPPSARVWNGNVPIKVGLPQEVTFCGTVCLFSFRLPCYHGLVTTGR